MKKSFLFLLISLAFTVLSLAQNTYVPDDNFEQALIDLGYDTPPLNNYVPTANIEFITSLNVSSKNISNLNGIEAFSSLEVLRCHFNQLTSLDVSSNLALDSLNCSTNQLTNLNVNNCTELQFLECSSNSLTNLNISQNIKF
jgi:Leucine-rich repeat (LRR) protein